MIYQVHCSQCQCPKRSSTPECNWSCWCGNRPLKVIGWHWFLVRANRPFPNSVNRCWTQPEAVSRPVAVKIEDLTCTENRPSNCSRPVWRQNFKTELKFNTGLTMDVDWYESKSCWPQCALKRIHPLYINYRMRLDHVIPHSLQFLL